MGALEQGLIWVAWAIVALVFLSLWVPMALARWCGTYLLARYSFLPRVTLVRDLDR